MSYLSALREAEKNWKRPPPPSDKNAKNTPNPIFGTFGAPSPRPFRNFEGQGEEVVSSKFEETQRPSPVIEEEASAEIFRTPGTVIGEEVSPKVVDTQALEKSYRAWLIELADGTVLSSHFIPPATEREVWDLHPEAVAVEVEQE